MGEESQPINADIVFKDAGIDTTTDPFQFDLGLIAFGKTQIYGLKKTAFVRCEPAHIGDVTVGLLKTPDGWNVGDELQEYG